MSHSREELEIVPKRFLNKVSGVRAPDKQCEWCRKNNIAHLSDVNGFPKVLLKELMKHLQAEDKTKTSVNKRFNLAALDKI